MKCVSLTLLCRNPIPSDRYGKVGFEAYCSHIQIRNLVIRRIAWTPVAQAYRPEF